MEWLWQYQYWPWWGWVLFGLVSWKLCGVVAKREVYKLEEALWSIAAWAFGVSMGLIATVVMLLWWIWRAITKP